MAQVKTGGSALRNCAVVVAVVALLLGVDFIALRGTRVGNATVHFDRSEPVRFQVARTGQPYLVEIESPRRVDGENVGFRLSYWVETPDGELIPGGSEIRTREKRSFRFVSEESGEHEVHVERDGLLLASSGGSARVTVYANNRQLLPRLLDLLPIH